MTKAWTPCAAVLLLAAGLAGCLGGDAGDDDGASGPEPLTPTERNGVPVDRPRPDAAANGSDNATYLQNLDYSRTHVHDYWGGQTARVLLDEAFTIETLDAVFATAFAPFVTGEARTGVGSLELTLPNATFVPEGTGKLLVEVDATGALKNGELQLSYSPADTGDYVEADDGAQGAQAAWTLALTPEMADLPHAKKTRWAWQLEAVGHGAYLDGDVSVRITAERLFDIQAWPEHDDFWDAGTLTRMDLANVSGSYDYLEQHLLGPEQGSFAWVRLPGGTIVPPETRALVVTMDIERNEADPKNLANGPVILIVKDGATSRGHKVMHGNAVEQTLTRIVYAIPVGPDTWDSPYATDSGWSWRVHAPLGYHDDERIIDIGGLDIGSGDYDVHVEAFRVIPPWLAEVLPDDIGR